MSYMYMSEVSFVCTQRTGRMCS